MNIQHYSNRLRQGASLLYPTDTIWGLGCDAFNESAIAKVQGLKNRDLDKPLIVLVENLEHLKRYVRHVHPRIENILYYYHKPATVIFEANGLLPRVLLSNEGTVAIRIIQHEFCNTLISVLKKPIVSTSANTQGLPFPTSFETIEKKIITEVDEIVSPDIAIPGGNEPSVLLKCTDDGELIFLRN